MNAAQQKSLGFVGRCFRLCCVIPLQKARHAPNSFNGLIPGLPDFWVEIGSLISWDPIFWLHDVELE